ncbi:hypothetical protein LCGC14_0445220 [marine sediment metagenome]|uniref:Uncharacterized protein n=1 Tax=marine sediment metagenome TaxID=412755 RepID=A0A0F9SJB4_9ZZZZ
MSGEPVLEVLSVERDMALRSWDVLLSVTHEGRQRSLELLIPLHALRADNPCVLLEGLVREENWMAPYWEIPERWQ